MNLETTPTVTGIVDEILAELPPLFFISEQQIPLLGKSPYFAHRKEKEGLFQAGVCLVSNAQSLLEAKQKELASIEAMVRMLEENEWAEHVGMLGGPIARRLETEITRMHNEQQALIDQQATLAAVPASVDAVSESIAGMVIEWVDGGLRLGTNWRPGLVTIITRRLRRHIAVFPAAPTPPAPEQAEQPDIARELIARLVEGLEWALNEIAIEPYEHCSGDNADAHRAAIDAVADARARLGRDA